MHQVEQVLRLVIDVADEGLIGAYLHGSTVLGGPRPASDLDILAVVRRSLDERQRRALVSGIMPISGSAVGARPVELTVVVQSDVRPWRYPPTCDFLYGEWLRSDYEAGVVPAPETTGTVALELSVTLSAGRTLSGPPPARVLDPVPTGDLARASVDGIPSLLTDLPGDTRNVLLTFARIWYTLVHGTIVAKDVAAQWALTHLAPEHRPALDYARRLYLTTTDADETWSDDLKAQVALHVDVVLAQIRHVAARLGIAA